MERMRLTIDEVGALAEAGNPAADAGELVAGVLRVAAPASAAALRATADLAAALAAVARDHRVEVRSAVVVGPHDLLRPEVALVRPVWPAAPEPSRRAGAGVGRRGAAGAPRWAAAGVALAVFIGDDEAPLRWRAHRCAPAGVREVWTVALDERRASRWRAPVDGRYALREPLPPGEAVAPDALPEGRVVPWC